MGKTGLWTVTQWRSLLCFLVLVFTGCSNPFTTEGRLEDYANRVQRVTGVSGKEWDSDGSGLRHYPRRRDRLWPTEESTIGLLDFAALGDCELQHLVGQKNSGLGAVMPVSQQLLYEHRFIATAPRCIERLEGGSRRSFELAKRLEAIVEAKKNEIPKVYWNATFGSPEFEKFFSLAHDPLPFEGEIASPTAVADALRYFISLDGKLGNSEFHIKSSELERQYKHLQSTRYGGRLLRTTHLLTCYLELVATRLEIRLEAGAICTNGNVGDDAQMMWNIFNNVYVADIQPYVSHAYQEAKRYLELTNTLAMSFDGQMPPRFEEYYRLQLEMDHEQGLWKKFERAVAHHTKVWQTFLEQCDLELSVSP